ncbi:TetR family transcriptional regulator [Chitinophaga skermanii]|uniref:TetR family transcriptional regulator n=1 Tax=Chitinophaga skermanii TaxID=331697 RepID=A0A327Q9W6_9BACT|nr:TetR/AcrR family transcriptional regulator [Chitinophaga skermanii]RAJ00422.1 TetR family transcriptional regulator [Chitinophaga skermanii]
MDTKSQILKHALELYNQQGVNSTTSRHIAAKMEISPGNLHYHFKHTEEIIEVLWKQLVTQFDLLMLELKKFRDINMEVLIGFTMQSFELVYKYRFIFLHFVEIGLRIPAIKKEYYALTQRREIEFLYIFSQLQQNKVMKANIPNDVLQSLVTQIFIIGDFWLSNNELTLKLKGNKAVAHYSKVFSDLFYPYLVKPPKGTTILT